MEITQILEVKNRQEWRTWLSKNYNSAKDIWLVYYNKKSSKERISYNDAVDEALCFGWIDSTTKAWNEESSVQRFSPRRKNSFLSELNKERVRRLIDNGLMTEAGLDSIKQYWKIVKIDGKDVIKLNEFIFPDDVLDILKNDEDVWNNYRKFPEHYKRIRIGWIDGARHRQDVFEQRLNYFIKMTKKNKMYGMLF